MRLTSSGTAAIIFNGLSCAPLKCDHTRDLEFVTILCKGHKLIVAPGALVRQLLSWQPGDGIKPQIR